MRGFGTKVVDGSVSPQEFIVDTHNSKILKFNHGNQHIRQSQEKQMDCMKKKFLMNLFRIPCLNDAQIKVITEYALRIENYFGTPQDIEWTIDKNGKIFILQCRPLAVSAANVLKPGEKLLITK